MIVIRNFNFQVGRWRKGWRRHVPSDHRSPWKRVGMKKACCTQNHTSRSVTRWYNIRIGYHFYALGFASTKREYVGKLIWKFSKSVARIFAQCSHIMSNNDILRDWYHIGHTHLRFCKCATHIFIPQCLRRYFDRV